MSKAKIAALFLTGLMVFGTSGAAQAKPSKSKGSLRRATVNKGHVLLAQDSSLTLMRKDAVQVTVTVDENTKFMGKAAVDGAQAGERALVISKRGIAKIVVLRPAVEDAA